MFDSRIWDVLDADDVADREGIEQRMTMLSGLLRREPQPEEEIQVVIAEIGELQQRMAQRINALFGTFLLSFSPFLSRLPPKLARSRVAADPPLPFLRYNLHSSSHHPPQPPHRPPRVRQSRRRRSSRHFSSRRRRRNSSLSARSRHRSVLSLSPSPLQPLLTHCSLLPQSGRPTSSLLRPPVRTTSSSSSPSTHLKRMPAVRCRTTKRPSRRKRAKGCSGSIRTTRASSLNTGQACRRR